MLKIDRYVRPDSIEEAYELLNERNSAVLGGMLWLRLQDRRISTAIDLCKLGLGSIEDEGQYIRIGAYATLRQIETDEILLALTNSAIADCVKNIIGVQFRNLATVGGSIFSRFGFGDLFTLFSALDAKVCFYKNGIVPICEFAAMGNVRDILTHVLIPKDLHSCAYISQRNSYADFPLLNASVVVRESEAVCAVGARPARAAVYRAPFDRNGDVVKETDGFIINACKSIKVSSDSRASAAYREKILPVLLHRAMKKAIGE